MLLPSWKGLEFLWGSPPYKPATPRREEDFWEEIRARFTLDPEQIYLNNGALCPSPLAVQEQLAQTEKYIQELPSVHLNAHTWPKTRAIRAKLAEHFGASPEEIAFTRNTTEAMENFIFGLNLKTGDEVLTSTHDYWRFINSFKQREKREGIRLTQIPMPTPAPSDEEVVELYEQNISPQTKVILVCHVNNLSGQILPIQKIKQMADPKGITVLVDGAHGFAQLPFKQADLGCDYYGTSLHKWLSGPIGTGMLYVKQDRIAETWPLFGAPERHEDSIHKFESVGTVQAAKYLALGEAIQLYEEIGAERKMNRLSELSRYWTDPFRDEKRIIFHTQLDKPEPIGAISTLQIQDVETPKLAKFLEEKYKIIVRAIRHPEFEGIRVTPNVYTRKADLDLFVEALKVALAKGVD